MNFKRFHESKNLIDKAWLTNDRQLSPSTGLPTERAGRIATINPIDVSNIDTVTLTFSLGTTGSEFFMYSIFSGDTLIERVANKSSGDTINVTNADALYICLYIGTTVTVDDVQWIMLNTGSTPLPYEPYSSEVWHDTQVYIRSSGEWVELSAYERSGGQWD